MGRSRRTCTVVGCQSTAGLHGFPVDLFYRRQWLRAIGLGENSKLPVRAGVCDLHFTRDSYSNFFEVERGFTTQLCLKSEAVPTQALQQPGPSALTPCHLVPKTTREIGCQTDVLKRHVSLQTDVEPTRTSKACDTGTLEIPLQESPRASPPPPKRRRCEVSDFDPNFHLDGSATPVDSSTPVVPAHKQKKYIVHEDSLMGLFRTCPVCTRLCIVDTMTIGTLLRVKQLCTHCEYFKDWSSQPMVKDIPAGNLQLCAAVLFTGSSFPQISKFMGALNIQGLSEQCFHKHQAGLLIPTVSWQWKLEQEDLMAKAIAGGVVTLGGDMRADSPGHSAKYGSYTMMDVKSNKVIDVQLVQSNEVGFIRSLTMLEERGLKVGAVVTDRHTGVQKFLRERRPDITHYFDPWHMGKGIGKKLDELGKKKRTQDVGPWRKSVVNHLYWSASSSSSGEEAVAKWTSVASHVQNIHRHENDLFPHCQHEPLDGEKERQWLKPSTASCETLSGILLAPRLVKDVAKISPVYHTSTIEAFHSLILRFSPKSVAYTFKGMLCRLTLAAMHYNENSRRVQGVTAAGELRYAIVHPQYKHGDYSVRALKTKPTTFYIDRLMDLLFECVVEDAQPYQQHSDQVAVPEPLCAQFDRPDK